MGERTARGGRDAFVRPFWPGADWNRPGAGGCGFTRVGLPIRSWANRSGAGRRCADAICHHRYWGTASCRGGRSLRRLAGCGAGKEMGERTARSGATRLCGPSGRAQIGIALARAAAASPASAFPSGHGRTDRQGDVFCCRATLATIAPRHAAKRRPALPFTRGYLFFQRAMAARNSSP